MNEEIHFLYEEINENINKDIEKILFQIKNPLSAKNARIIKRLTKELIKASAKQIYKEEIKPADVHGVKIEEIKPGAIEINMQEAKQEVQSENLEQDKFAGYQPSSLQDKAARRDSLPRNITQITLIKDGETGELLVRGELEENEYRVYEPVLSDDDVRLLNEVKQTIGGDINSIVSRKNMWKILRKASKNLNVYFDDDNFLKLRYYIVRNLLGYGAVEPFVHDNYIQRIICEGQGEKVMVIRDNKKLRTNVMFKSKDELNNMLNTLAERTFQKISVDDPVLDSIYRGFRIQGTLGTDMVSSKFIVTRV